MTIKELLIKMPMRQKYLGTVNDAHFVLRKLVSSNKETEWWAYYEDEDTLETVEGYSFRGFLHDVLSNLYLKVS